MAREWRRGELTGLALIAGGFMLVATSVGGYYVGREIDRALGTSPLWASVGLLLGLLIGFVDLYVISAWVMKQQPPPPPPLKEDEQLSEDESGRPRADGEED